MNLEHLQTFLNVAEQGSFTKAAHVMGVSKGLVSRHIEALETKLGTKLFHRTTRKMSLSEAGQVLVIKARQIRSTAKAVELELSELKSDLVGTLKLAAAPQLSKALCRSFVPRFVKQNPNLIFQIDGEASLKDIESGQYDIALRVFDTLPENVIAKSFASIRSVLVASPTLYSTLLQSGQISDLKEAPILLNHANENWNLWNMISHTGESYRTTVTGNLGSSSYECLLELALNGLGIANLPYYQVETYLKNGTLRHVLPEYSIHIHNIDVIYTKHLVTPRKIRTLIDLLFEWKNEHTEYFLP